MEEKELHGKTQQCEKRPHILAPEEIINYFHKYVRILCPNMIFIQGLPRELLHPKLLQRKELFGQYGTIKKISIGKASYSQIGRS